VLTYSECVSAALGIRHAKRMRHVVICRLSGSTVFLPKQDLEPNIDARSLIYYCSGKTTEQFALCEQSPNIKFYEKPV